MWPLGKGSGLNGRRVGGGGLRVMKGVGRGLKTGGSGVVKVGLKGIRGLNFMGT